MKNRVLGKSKIEIKPLGLGCAAIGGYYTRNGRVVSRGQIDDHETIRAIHTALDHEIQLFDVANIYGAGHAERILGKALSQGKRQQTILQVKFGASFDEVTRRQIDYKGKYDTAWIANSIEGSLRRLQTDYIDILQFQIADYEIEWLPEIIDALGRFVLTGKIRAYSYGTGDVERARLFAEAPYCAAIITNHNILTNHPALFTLLDTHHVALLAGLPFFTGLLTGKYTKESIFADDDLRHTFDFHSPRFAGVFEKIDAVSDILQSEGRTTAQGALAWIWANHPSSIPIPGFKTAEQVKENASAVELGPLNDTQMMQITDILNSKNDG